VCIGGGCEVASGSHPHYDAHACARASEESGNDKRSQWVARCTIMRHPLCVAARRMTTKNYSDEARERLGKAHRRARQAAGYKARTAYAKAVGIALRSVVSLEKGDPVGEYIVEAVGRFLPTWNEDTAQAILEGGPIPSSEPESSDLVHIAVNALADLEITGADVSTYNWELARWEHILGDEADITSVRKEAHRVAVERMANPQNNPTP
jgi:hypothetical protein